jgi:hypothetical protein
MQVGSFPEVWEYFQVEESSLPLLLSYDPNTDQRLTSKAAAPLEEGEFRQFWPGICAL